jgi:UTP-glucose-1-phosphate uridylyltransferase
VRYDTGTPQGWLEAQVAFALKRPDFKQLKQRLRRLLQ